MKAKLLLSFLFIIGLQVYSQTPDTVAKIDDKVLTQKVYEIIEKNEYVRIPIEDFDDKIENKITTSLDTRFKTLIGFLVAIIGVLSTLSVIQSNRSRNLLKEQVSTQISSELTAKTNEYRNYYEQYINSRLKDMENQIKDKIEMELKSNMENIRNVELQLQQSNNQIKAAEEYLLNIEFEELRKQIMSREYVYEITLDRTINLLKNAEAKEKQLLLPEIINLLTYIYYDYKKYNEVTGLLDKYEGKIKFVSTSYINAALTAISDYHNFNSVSQRMKALDYLNKSLELTQGYGQAQALKLEIFMMDYLRAEEDKKELALKDAKQVLNDLLNSESNAPSYETINRLNTDFDYIAFKKYVETLYKLFPEELKLVQKKSDEYHSYLTKL